MRNYIIKDILITLAFLIVGCTLAFMLEFYQNSQLSIACCLILAVLFTARFTHGYVYGIASAIAGTLVTNYFFTFPFFKFNLSTPVNFVTVIAMLTVSTVTSAVTTRLRSQKELRNKAELEMMRTNLMRSVSHDLRTPLTSIMGAANVLKENDKLLDDNEKMELYEQINSESNWLINMVENLLSVTKLKGNVEPVHKTLELAEELISVAANKIQKYYKNVNIITDASDELLFVPMDITLVSQVLINLIENSIRHGKSSHYIKISVQQIDEQAIFSVEDRGCGLPKQILSSINSNEYVQPYSDSDSNKYMGIGLSVCNSIIKAHGGFMCAKNLNEGAVISFSLPLEESEI